MQTTPLISAAMPSALTNRLQAAIDVARDIDATAHVALGVVRYGQPWAALCTDSPARALNEIEQNCGGPALDSLWSGRIVRIGSTRTSPHWPEFVQACRQLGVGSVAAFPISIDGARVGIISIASHNYYAFGREETRIGVRAATRAATILDS